MSTRVERGIALKARRDADGEEVGKFGYGSSDVVYGAEQDVMLLRHSGRRGRENVGGRQIEKRGLVGKAQELDAGLAAGEFGLPVGEAQSRGTLAEAKAGELGGDFFIGAIFVGSEDLPELIDGDWLLPVAAESNQHPEERDKQNGPGTHERNGGDYSARGMCLERNYHPTPASVG